MQASARTLSTLAAVPFVMVLGNSMIIPVLPNIQRALNINEFQLGLVITLFSVPAGVIIPLAGFISDHYGRKKVIISGLVLYGIGGILAGSSFWLLGENAYSLLLGGRVIQGIGAAGTAPIAMALTGDLFTGKNRSRSLGIIEAANGFGKVASPILGAAIGLIAWFATFLFFPLVIVPVVLGMFLLVREPINNEGQKIRDYLKSILNIFEQKASLLLAAFFGGMVALLILFGVLFFLSNFLEDSYNLTGIIKGLVLAIPVLLMSVSSFITGILIKRKIVLMKWLVVVGMSIIGIFLGLLSVIQNVYLFIAMISIAGIGTGLTLPCLNTLITGSVQSDRRGLVTSLYGSVRFIGVAAGPPVFGLLMNMGRPVMFWTSTALALAAAVVALIFIRAREIQEVGEKPEITRDMPLIIPEFIFVPAPAPKKEPEK